MRQLFQKIGNKLTSISTTSSESSITKDSPSCSFILNPKLEYQPEVTLNSESYIKLKTNQVWEGINISYYIWDSNDILTVIPNSEDSKIQIDTSKLGELLYNIRIVDEFNNASKVVSVTIKIIGG